MNATGSAGLPSPMAAPLIASRVIELIADLPKNSRVLDIATGKGYMLVELEKAGYGNLACADINEENFALDRTRYGFVRANFNEALPFSDGEFDVVISSETIEHVENPRAFLRELVRVMRPGGRMILSTPNVTAVSSRLRFLFAGDIDGHLRGDYDVSGHITVLPDWALERCFEETGLRIKKKTYNCSYIPILSRLSAFRSQSALLNRAWGWILMYSLVRS